MYLICKYNQSPICDVVWCNARLTATESCLIGCVYRPPNCSASESKELFNQLNDICTKHTNTNIIIVGDFNYPNIDWNSKTFCNASTTFECFIQECMLEQHVTKPTRGNNVLDLVLTRTLHKCPVKVKLLPPIGRSDHACLSILIHELKLQAIASSSTKLKYNYK